MCWPHNDVCSLVVVPMKSLAWSSRKAPATGFFVVASGAWCRETTPAIYAAQGAPLCHAVHRECVEARSKLRLASDC